MVGLLNAHKGGEGRGIGSFRAGAMGRCSLMVLAAGLAFATPAFAQSDDQVQAEWAQQYDAAPSMQVQRSTVPVLSEQTIAATQQAIETYQGIVSRGGWAPLPNIVGLHVGSKSNNVVLLRQRLIGSGDLEKEAGLSPVFDAYVENAVKRFQARHGLSESGTMTAPTLTEMNVPADTRLQELQINLVRLRSFSGNLGDRYVMANIPAAVVETVENGTVFSHHVAGVGKIDRQSPVLQTKATDINFNPFWTVPASIIRKDLIPKMQADPNYLTDNHIRIFNKEEQEVPPSSINWNSMDATNYKYREDPGENNSLGVVRINIANPYGVYMHDTATKGVFGDDFRFVSSGCIRLQNVRDYVAWLLKDTPGWSRDQIDAAIRSGQRVDVKLAQPVNVYWVYITAWASPDGVVQFRPDIYQRDGFGTAVTAANTPSQDENAAVQPAISQE